MVRFTLNHSPASPVATTWDYATQPDSAREGTDYVGQRGTVTLPANATTAVVEVPLIADAWKEPTESFALLVWPVGGSPFAPLTEVPKPATVPGGAGSFEWQAGPIGVSENTFFINRSLGALTAGTWGYERDVGLPDGSAPDTVLLGGEGRWMALVDREPDPASGLTGFTRLHVADRLGSSQSPLPLNDPVRLPGLPLELGSVSVRGNVACVLSFGACRFYQLDPVAPPRLMGQCLLSRSSRVLFDGGRVVSSSEDATVGLQIFEAADASLSRWRLVKTLPGAKQLAALDGDRLVLRADAGGSTPQTFFHVHERSAGGPDGWGETAVLTVDDAEGPRPLGLASLSGSLLLIGDSAPTLGAGLRAGKIHAFMKAATGAGWAPLGALTAPGAPPGDTFGWRAAAGGTTLLATSRAGLAGTPGRAWTGALAGGKATILDDDQPAVQVSATSEFEPSAAPRTAKGWLWMTHPSSDPLTVTWHTESGSAVAGQDFSGQARTTVIPAGAYAVPIEVPVLPDAAAESDEDFSVVITSVAGPTATFGPPVRWTIRDTDRAPVVSAPSMHLYEGLADPKPAIRLDPAGTTLSASWSIRETAPPPVGFPRDLGEFATSGDDFAPASGAIHSDDFSTQRLPVSTVRDGRSEYVEMATLAVDLDPLASAASYGTRAYQSIADLPSAGTYTGNVSTDGDRVAVQVQLAEGGASLRRAARLFVRDPAAPGGWRYDQLLRLADFGVPDLAGLDFLRLRRGRLCYYLAPAGRVWILVEAPGAPGSWKLEASFLSLHGVDSPFHLNADFDGEVFVAARRSGTAGNQVSIHERGNGDWGVQQDFFMPDLVSDVRLDGGNIVAIASKTPASRSIAAIERRGYGAAPWVRTADSPLPSDLVLSDPAPQLHRDVMVVPIFDGDPSLVLRRQDTGIWAPEQRLNAGFVAMDRGVLLGVRTFVDSGSSANRWVPLPSSELDYPPPYAGSGSLVYDHCRRVLVGAAEYTSRIPGQDPVPGHYIAEPGANVRIIDSESFQLDVRYNGHPDGEHPTAESRNVLEINRFPTTLVDISIPFRTTGGGTATPGLDYRPVSGTMIRRAGNVLAGNPPTAFAVPILPDRLLEGMETIEIEFGTPSFGVVEPSRILLPIAADAEAPAFTLPRPSVVFEPLAGQRTFTLPLRLVSAYSQPLVVRYGLGGLTAGAGDFIQGPGTVTVPAGSLDVPVPLTVLADALGEGPESVRLSILSVDGISIPSAKFDLVIDDAFHPGGVDDAFTTVQNTPLAPSPARSLAANDAPGMGAFSLARPAEHGTVTVEPGGTFRYEPDANFLGTDRFAYQGTIAGTELLREGASWRWLHPLNGQDPGNSIAGFQANWMEPDFDDSSWAAGTGLMGYGTLGAGAGQPITTSIGTPAGNRYSAYFRATFTAPDAPAPGFTIRFACDDAAIFYLNGAEIGRYAKAPDPAFFSAPDAYTLLSLNFHDGEEETVVRTLSVPSAQVLPGRNVLAISLHNAATSSDLGLRVLGGDNGLTAQPVLVEVNVTDGGTPPRVRDDAFRAAVTSRPIDSLFFAGGSVFSNDGLLDAAGKPYDPILEVETGGAPAGAVSLDKGTGQFRIDAPQAFFGSTAFTYRIRDKDGWSHTATVNVTADPVRDFDIWRESLFGGGSANPGSAPEVDGDGDALANLAEFAFGTDPKSPDFAPILSLGRRGGAWVALFQVQNAFGRDCVIRLESSASLGSGHWTPLALLNNDYEEIEEFADGVTKSSELLPSTRLLYAIQLPPSTGPARFLRLRVTQERHLLDP